MKVLKMVRRMKTWKIFTLKKEHQHQMGNMVNLKANYLRVKIITHNISILKVNSLNGTENLILNFHKKNPHNLKDRRLSQRFKSIRSPWIFYKEILPVARLVKICTNANLSSLTVISIRFPNYINNICPILITFVSPQLSFRFLKTKANFIATIM